MKRLTNSEKEMPTLVDNAEYWLQVYFKLKDIEDAEEQGELVLYPTNAYFIMNNKIYEGWVQEAVYSVYRKPIFDIRYDDNSLNSYSGYLGNTVFLTKAEAEAKLKELEE